MSRAFVDEDASASREAEAPEIKIPLPPGSRNYLTPAGAEALSRELHELTGLERPRLLSRIAALSSGGGEGGGEEPATLSRRLSETERRIAYLYAMSSLAEVPSQPPPGPAERVTFGAWVLVEGLAGERRSYRIVGVDEADPERGWIGWASPVARALVGRRLGERCRIRLPAGAEELRVVGIEFRGE